MNSIVQNYQLKTHITNSADCFKKFLSLRGNKPNKRSDWFIWSVEKIQLWHKSAFCMVKNYKDHLRLKWTTETRPYKMHFSKTLNAHIPYVRWHIKNSYLVQPPVVSEKLTNLMTRKHISVIKSPWPENTRSLAVYIILKNKISSVNCEISS